MKQKLKTGESKGKKHGSQGPSAERKDLLLAIS